MSTADLADEVRARCAQIAAEATHVRIDGAVIANAYADLVPADPPALDPAFHWLDGDRDEVARQVLIVDTINFGSGWFPTLRKSVDPRTGRPLSGYFTIAGALAGAARVHGPWSAEQLRAIRTETVADLLRQPRDHELMALYAQALRELGRFLSHRTALEVIAAAQGSAVTLAGALAAGMAMFADRGFYKRAQIVPSDLALAGVATFSDLDRLTIFADNLVPHVLRCDGVLAYDAALAQTIDAGVTLPMDVREREIRGCAVHACELLAARLAITPRALDSWLWNRGQAPEYKARPRHRTRCVYY